MSTQDIVQKLWNLCNVLRDDGITYHQYVTELTYILFLKMADETGADKDIPEAYRWGSLISRSGIDLKSTTIRCSASWVKNPLAAWHRFTPTHPPALKNQKISKNHHGDR